MKKLLLIFFISTSFAFGFNEWEEVYNVSNMIPKSIECPDSLNCFVIMSNGSKINLYNSKDQGKTWDMIYNNFPGAETVASMSVPDTSNIFISFFYDGIIYKSHDSGKTFEKVTLDTELSIEKIEMRNKNRGIAFTNLAYYVTFDSWKSYKKIDMLPYGIVFNPIFVNDSVVYMIYLNETAWYLSKLNIFTTEADLNYIAEKNDIILDLCIVNENLMFACGKSHEISGGSGHDAIYKSTDGGVTWKRVLDLYNDRKINYTFRNPFGLQSIAFKDSLTGIAVGQFGKIVYTYDGGESWIYENELHESIQKNIPPTMIVRYAGSEPIIAVFTGNIFNLKADNLLPDPDNKFSIGGKVWDGNEGQPGIPIINGYGVTMTDKDGYYRFGNLKEGNYQVRALNRYYDGKNLSYYIRPYLYSPEMYEIELTRDTTGFDFNAEDIRSNYTLMGIIKDNKGDILANMDVQIGEYTVKTDSTGNYVYYKAEAKEYFIKPIDESYTYAPTYYDTLITSHSFTLDFTATPATSVWESANSSSIILHPNPAIEYIEIIPPLPKGDSELASRGIYDVKIYNTLGQCVEEIPLNPPLPKGETRIDVSHLPRGVYFVRFGNYYEKFVKW